MVHPGAEVRGVNLQIDWPKLAKNRAPVILTSVAMLEATKAILSMEHYEKQLGWLKKAQKDQKNDYAVASIMDKRAGQTIEEIITTKLGIGSCLKEKCSYAGGAFDTVYETVFYHNQESQHLLSLTSCCCSEAGLLPRGAEALYWKLLCLGMF
jgi:hypothetical protein